MIEIESGRPIPGKRFAKGIRASLRALNVGDCALLKISLQNATVNALHVLGKGNYTCRTEDEGTRVWRTR